MVRLSDAEMDVLAKQEGHGSIYGLCDYERQRIYIRKASKKFSASLQKHTFWHEYFHMALHLGGRERLARDETLVDTLAASLLQAINTSE